MKRTLLMTLACLLGMTIAMGTDSGLCQEKPIVLKLGHAVAPEHPYHLGAVKYAEMVGQRTKGKVKIDVYPSTQLGNERDMVEGLQLGTIDLVVTSTGPLGGFVPKMFVVDLPFLFRDREHAYKVLDGPVGRELMDAFAPKGIKGLAFWENGFRQITNNVRPIEKPEDLKGIKIRTMENKIHLASFRAFGASPTPMAWSEVYTALQQGTIDGQENPLSTIMANSLWEVQKYLVLTSHAQSAFIAQINEGIWQKMTPETQKVWMDTWKEVMDQAQADVKAADQALIAQWKSHGQVVIEPDLTSFKEATKDVWKEYAPKAWGEGVYEQIQALE